MPETIKQLHSDGYKIFILSSNSVEAIRDVLKKYDLDEYVMRIYSGATLFGKAKRLNSFFKKEHLSKEQCVYIGDEVRDIEATKQVGLKCIAVEWGYSAPAKLKMYKPEAMASSPKLISTAIKSLV